VLCAPILAAAFPVRASADAPSVAITSSSEWRETVGPTTYLHLVGEVLNSGRTATNIAIALSLKAMDGHEVGYDTTFAGAHVLAIGERSPFEGVVIAPPLYDHFTASVSAAPSPASPAHQFSFSLDACPQMDPTSAACQNQVPQDRIAGSVRNDNAVPVDNVAALFTFLDASGNAIAQNSAMVDDSLTIAPSAFGNFVVNRPSEPGWSSMRFMAEPDYPIDLNPSTLTFGDQLKGTPSPAQTITLSNNGMRTVTVGPIAATGSIAATGDFSQTNNCAAVPIATSCAVSVVFSPTQTGSESEVLTITDDAAGTPQSIPLSGTGVFPIATLSTTNLAFVDPVVVGTTVAKTLTLTNTGTTPLRITAVTASGDFLADSSLCPAALDPNAVCTITVTFAPRRPGPQAGQLTISDNAGGGQQAVALSGTGLGSGVGLSATSVSFGNQSLGVSRNRLVTVTNTGNAPLTVQSIAAPAAIVEGDTCRIAALAPSAQCGITLTFAPTLAGAVSGDVVLTDNAADSPQTISVAGTGVAPLTLDQTSLSFGNQLTAGSSLPQTVTITNTGSVDVAISSIQAIGPFGQANDCAPVLTVGGHCTATVRFAPDQLGAQHGTISITHDAFGSPQVVALDGTGVSARWESLGGVLPAGAVATSWGSHLDVFVRGTDQQLWHRSFDGTAWSNWEALGGPIGSEPAAVSWGPNHIDIFVRGTDGRPWWKTFDNGSFNNWQPMDGLLGSTPTVTSWAIGHLDLFTRGTDGQMWQNTFDAGIWHDWQPLGGVLDTEPAATSWGPGRIDVFVKGTDNRLWQNTFAAGRWSDWQPHYDGVLGSVPAAVSSAPGKIDVFVRGTDGRLWHKRYNGGWVNWTDSDAFGGIITSKPGTIARATGTLDVFARGTDLALWHLALGIR
jgi:hypothetical protein